MKGSTKAPERRYNLRALPDMKTSVVIRMKNEEATIGETLEKLLSQTYGASLEVVLVDSGSTDNTIDIAGSFPVRILTIAPEQFTFGRSLNHGIRHADGDIICCLSAHCVPCSLSWLSELVRPIEEGNAQATFGRQIPVKGVNPFEEVFLLSHFPEVAGTASRVSFSNANCAFLKALWREQAFDEEIPGWEDYLWYLRLRDRHVFGYVPSAGVFHSHPFSWRRMAGTAYRDGRALKYMRRAYRLDIVGESASATGTISRVLHDMIDQVAYSLRSGHRGYAVVAPLVKLCYYLFFARGYFSVV